MTAPQVYVGLFPPTDGSPFPGGWVNFHQSPSDVWDDIEAALAPAHAPGIVGILAVMGFDPLRIVTFDDFDFLIAAAHGIVEYGEAFACWADRLTDRSGPLRDQFLNSYLGSFDTVMDYAELFTDAAGMPLDRWGHTLDSCIPVLPHRDTIVRGPTQVHVFAGRPT